ncbi:Mth938-like domain-containing protein [Aquisalimonas sp.]|uniref:Mth938-like domain-containing protein n=1 Tax=unclassified Aquisalimonas TaxID=2644645 RepID=UPI0025C2D9C1|nr:Mth938-like domain-containing protein [Aquisalimonas sp.]
MKLTLENTGEANRIRSYDVGTITVNETEVTSTLLLTPEQLHDGWGPADVGELGNDHMDAITAMAPELLLIGTGRRQQFPDRRLMARTIQAGLGIEVMTTEAACRTYNVLAAEGRQVAAVLFMIEADSR